MCSFLKRSWLRLHLRSVIGQQEARAIPNMTWLIFTHQSTCTRSARGLPCLNWLDLIINGSKNEINASNCVASPYLDDTDCERTATYCVIGHWCNWLFD